MKTFNSIIPLISQDSPLALTIGNFDGVHLGHRAILDKMASLKGTSVVLTFANHPSEILFSQPAYRLTTLNHKLTLLEKCGVNATFVLPFTTSFSKQSPEEFLTALKKQIPFTHLFLGHDAVIGHNRSGTPEILAYLSKTLAFHLEYIPPVAIENCPISSSRIRASIQKGDFSAVQTFLGRSFSCLASIKIYDETSIFVSLEGLCLPPTGNYSVSLNYKTHTLKGIGKLRRENASLEIAFSTFHNLQAGNEIEIWF